MFKKIIALLLVQLSMAANAKIINFSAAGVFFEHVDGGYPAISGADGEFSFIGSIDLGASPLSTEGSNGEMYYQLPGSNSFNFGLGSGSFSELGIWVTDDASEDIVTITGRGSFSGRDFALYLDFIFDPSVLGDSNQISAWPLASAQSTELWLWEMDALGNDIAEMESTLSTVQVSAVPVPTAAWLFGSALISLIGFKRQHN